MTPRARRLVVAAAVIVAILFAGRWLVTFLAERWWAAAISPAARQAVTSWSLLGVLLDAGAVLIASAWFAGQALLVARAIGSVQVERRIGELRVREAIPIRLLLLGAVATGVLLGLVTGIGARAWRAPVALAMQDLHYGISDPLLGVDLGILVGEYPVWRLAQRFALLLATLGLAFSLLLYLGIGAVRRQDGKLDLHPDARRHLGGLLAIVALVIAIGYLLGPYRLATSVDVPLALAAASTRVLAAHAAAGAAIAVAIISVGWAIRTRHSLLAASWAVLGLAAVTEWLVVPAFVAEAAAMDDQLDTARRLDARLYGITLTGDVASGDSLPPSTALWDPASLAAWAEHREAEFLGASPVRSTDGGHWLMATRRATQGGAIEVTRVAAGTLSSTGLPQPVDGDSGAAIVAADPRVLPGAAAWRVVGEEAGVPVGGALRRAALAWARQAPRMLALAPDAEIDWALDPRERVARLVPALEWRAVGLAVHQGRLHWLVSGLAAVDRAPLTPRLRFGDRQVAGLVPALVAAVRAHDGAVRVFVDPAADSLGHAWARAVGPLVEPLAALPAWLRDALPYPSEWFEVQLAVLERARWGQGTVPTDPDSGEPVGPTTIWGSAGPRLQVMLEDPARQVPATLVEAERQGGVATITVRSLVEFELPGLRERARAWRRTAGFSQVRDSVRAAGDTLLAGPLRYHLGPAGVLSWQPFRSAGRRGEPAIRWVATAAGTAVGGGRQPVQAWATVVSGALGADGEVPFDLVSRFEAIRGWLSRADSALARGDLTAFARAWEAVRGLMLEPPRE